MDREYITVPSFFFGTSGRRGRTGGGGGAFTGVFGGTGSSLELLAICYQCIKNELHTHRLHFGQLHRQRWRVCCATPSLVGRTL